MVYQSRSPQDPDDVLVSAELVEPAAVPAVVALARQAQTEWSAVPAPARANALNRAAQRVEQASAELTELGIREVGKPRTEMTAEVARGVAILRYYAQQALDPDGATFPPPDGRSLLMARRRPHGVAGLITPWNFPVAIPLWKVAPALAYGNGVVLKPARQALAIALRLGELLSEDLPDGLFEVLATDGSGADVLMASADVVSFTGSVEVGHHVIAEATKHAVPVQAEMGGQNPSIVLQDADFGRAADAIASAAMGYAGQKCTATSRVVVVGNASNFEDALVAAIEKLPVGDPAEAVTVVGPVIDEAARRSVIEAANGARSQGGRVVTGGAAAERKGWFVQPTLVDGVSPEATLAQTEVFGPIAVLLPATDVDEAVAIANGVEFGLSAAIFTTDLDRALSISGRLEAGMVRVNAPTSGVDFYAPFGGVKGSSYGPREQGKAARDFYTWSQTITVSPARA
ncbi:MAG TPA: aldehyde dehydrogenase family protein [Acidimicrobiales bacterium]|nr:aldehyde dehydrogenase family protein [Acidimicrobiales bacterium]